MHNDIYDAMGLYVLVTVFAAIVLVINVRNVLSIADCGASPYNVTTDEACTEVDVNATVTPNVTTEGAYKIYLCRNLLTRTRAKIDYCPVELCQSNGTWRSASLSCGSSECFNGTSEDYMGSRICTATGKICQRWDVQTPWTHPYTNDSMFSDGNTADARNYCRDPNGTRGAPWCYTGDNSTEWEFCDIPDCTAVTIAQGKCPGDYCGDLDFPISTDNICSHTKLEDNYTSNVGSLMKYTCQSLLEGVASLVSFCPVRTCQTNFYWTSASLSCGVNECYEAGQSWNYTGKRNCSASGYTCQTWNTQSPHAHNFTSSDFPDTDINGAGSFCRDPGGIEGQPWCFTTEPIPATEYCDIPQCSTLPINHGKCPPPDNCSTSPYNVTTDELCTEVDHNATAMPNVTTEGAYKIYLCKNLLTRTKAKIDYCPVELCQSNGTWRSASLSCGSSECFNGSSDDYIGSRICTTTGKICQRWDTQAPWAHPYTNDSMFSDGSVADASNYCRDPNATRGAPWCYTDDPGTEWEYCDIPDCSAVTIAQGICPGDYCGDPEAPISTDSICSQTKLEGNYTSNVGSLMKHTCQTLIDGFFSLGSYCPVRICQNSFYWTSASLSCGVNECYEAGQSRNYTGKRNCSASGYTCQAWNTQSPHAHNFTSSDFPDSDLNEAGSYCRDPGGSEGQPWCFTTEPVPVMEYCDIPECSSLPVNHGSCPPPPDCGTSPYNVTTDEPCTEVHLNATVSPNITTEGAIKTHLCKNLLTRTKAKINYCPVEVCQSDGTWRKASLSCGSSECFNGTSEDYTGRRICTATGKICQRWDTQTPWTHPYIHASMFPEMNITYSNNYCRDPNGTRGAPWCYTGDNSTEWEFCDIPDCTVVTIAQGNCPGDYCGDLESPISTDNMCSQTKHDGNYTRNIGSIIMYSCRSLLVGFYSLTSYCPVRTCQSNFYWNSGSLSCGVNECYEAGQSRNYTGRRNCSASGYTCQAWNTQSPHAHNFTSSDFPDADIHEAGSYCRDPGGSEGQPWCFTSETVPAMEYCDIPECSTLPVNHGSCIPPADCGVASLNVTIDEPCTELDVNATLTPNVTIEGPGKIYLCKNLLIRTKARIDYCPVEVCQPNALWRSATLSCGSSECFNGTSEDYIGSRICTATGKICQRWDTQTPWVHPYTHNAMFPDKNITETRNYCRDPNGIRGAPWCYTDDPTTEWEFCDIPNCLAVTISQGICPGDYCGDAQTTVSTDNVCTSYKIEGFTRTVGSLMKYTCQSLLAGFYTVASYCPVRACQNSFHWDTVSLSCGVNECYREGQSWNYTGRRNCTASGYTCQAWNKQSTHSHNFKSSDFPDHNNKDCKDLHPACKIYFAVNKAGSFCRDPGGSQGQPWCFTTEADPVMEYCDIPQCSNLPVNFGKCPAPPFRSHGLVYKRLNVDRPGFDLQTSIRFIRTPTSCCSMCNEYPFCVMVTFNNTDGLCTLYQENIAVSANIECSTRKCYLIEYLI